MKSTNRQAGFAEIFALLIAIVVGTSLVVAYQAMKAGADLDSEAEAFKNHLLYVKEQINAYEADQLIALGSVASPTGSNTLPPNWTALSPVYIPTCTTADANAGRCRLPSATPWGSAITLTRQLIASSSNYRVVLSIPFPALNAATQTLHNQYRAALAAIPGWSFDTTTQTASISVERIGQELQHTALVKRSGDDSKLTGDWDVGGTYSIVNARDVTIRGNAGTQRSLGGGVIRSFVARHNDRVNKPDCPTGFTPEIVTSIKGLYNQSAPNRFAEISSSRAYAVVAPTFWTVGLDYYAKVNGNWTLLHDGEVNVTLNCI